tara:strand:+ start:303 stop:539 length:237 start_codon:yes stop_codon:yes gene_type:complete
LTYDYEVGIMQAHNNRGGDMTKAEIIRNEIAALERAFDFVADSVNAEDNPVNAVGGIALARVLEDRIEDLVRELQLNP